MTEFRNRKAKYCRWCGKLYFASQPTDRDGFCTGKHKQALYRSHKKYVTATDGPRSARKKS